MEKIASQSNWSIAIDVGKIEGIAHILLSDRIIASSEDVFALLSECPVPVAQSLRTQLVSNLIQEAGGADAFQKAATNNRIAFGSDFYAYMDEATLIEFSLQGIELSYKI